MKARIFTLLFVMTSLFGSLVTAQPLHWREDSPAGWVPMLIEEETDAAKVTEGLKSTRITFTETGTPYFVCDTFDVAGGAYNFSIDVYDNDPGAEYSVRIFFHTSTGEYIDRATSDYTLDNAEWQSITMSGDAPANTGKVYIAVRAHDVADFWTGSSTFWVDNSSYTEGADNLILNPGYEEWPVIQEFVLNWREDSPAGWNPMVIAKETNPAKVTEGSKSVRLTFTETGTPYFVTDTFAIASLDYTFSIDVYDNDPGAEYSVRLFFHDAEGNYIDRAQSDYTLDNPDFQTLSMTGTAPDNSALVVVAVRAHDVPDSWTGEATFWLDNSSYSDGITDNLILNPGFEEWVTKAIFASYSFNELDPVVFGDILITDNTVNLLVPFQTDLTNLVATFELSSGAVATVDGVEQVSGVTANDFSNAVVYALSVAGISDDWTVIVNKEAASSEKEIFSFKFDGLNPSVTGAINAANHSISCEVPFGTDVTNLVPTILFSDLATISPASGAAADFTNPVTYTVTAEDGSTQDYVVSVSITAQGLTTLFFEDFDALEVLPEGWIVINNDGYIQAEGEERWQDSAWLVSTTNRVELQGTKVAMASSYTSNMPMDGRADDWMILPTISLGENSRLSWQAMSTTTTGNYPDDYMVLIAPANENLSPSIPYFEENAIILIEVAPESWSAQVGNPGQGLSSYDIDLKEAGFESEDVWIAFVLTTDLTPGNSSPGGSNLAVDNIKVVDGLTGLFETPGNSLSASIYPNPATGSVGVLLNLDKAQKTMIEVLDLGGRIVSNTSYDAVAGFNKLSVDISSLQNGLYLVRTRVNEKVNVTKLVVQ